MGYSLVGLPFLVGGNGHLYYMKIQERLVAEMSVCESDTPRENINQAFLPKCLVLFL